MGCYHEKQIIAIENLRLSLYFQNESMSITDKIKEELQSFSTKEKQEYLPKFFKTEKGQYGEGDKFLGVVVPDTRKVAKKYKDISFNEIAVLIQDEYHECRLCALLMLVERFKKSDEITRKKIVDFYLSHTQYINNWDLVDLSCKDTLGEYLVNKERNILYNLAESESLWEQRIAIVSTFAFIRRGDLADIFQLSEKLMSHKHDLMHKAIGWMLREAGKKDKTSLISFLNKNYRIMPRTMLRYSIEKLTPEERIYYMKK